MTSDPELSAANGSLRPIVSREEHNKSMKVEGNAGAPAGQFGSLSKLSASAIDYTLGEGKHSSSSASSLSGAENYREALQDILIALNDGKAVTETAKKIVIGGVGSQQSVSDVAFALAVTSANLGFKVLLVDAKGGKGDLHDRLRMPDGEGLSDMLKAKGSPHRYPKPTEIPNLALLTAGKVSGSFPSLLARERVFHRLQPIARHFDYIIVDAGYCLATSLARLGIGADNLILGVEEHKTSMKEVEATLSALQNEMVPQPAILLLE